MRSTTPLFSVLSLGLVITLHLVSATTTIGPLAPISIHKLPAYSTARPCAAGCLVFNGIWACGVNAGYHDLGTDLGCGCGPNNACFCSAGLAKSASSYISSCVSAKCTSFGDVGGDLTSMLGLYDGYCQTANVEIASSVPATTTIDGAEASKGVAASVSTRSTETVPARASASATAISTQGLTEADKKEDEGLSKSDVIALATGLGVGIPSLLVGAWALYLQLLRRRSSRSVPSIVGTTSQAGSQIQMLPTNRPQYQIAAYQQPISEMGSQRGGRYY
ncbi:hypothetical protein BU25DRAFT_465098 [Macroventuria anomochaeta]|uniref:Uncharacterized protein n=1 Tax=Macroventuria anomochaeta TaxID=301207 RepID=A0ACB6SK09_9PLEO|nr:uncharacterized protein BU25DRAFT_465098 [Macroventuria anomochaeta]KAF2633884.1 hypothetical protein BU25DRAFT_465098 [Macroventuria anomochaeta]